MKNDFKQFYPEPIQIVKVNAEQQICNHLQEELTRDINRRICEEILKSYDNINDPLNTIYEALKELNINKKCSEKIYINGYGMDVDYFLRLAVMIAKEHEQDYIEVKGSQDNKIDKKDLESITYVIDKTLNNVSGDYDYIRMHELKDNYNKEFKKSIYIPVGNINIANNTYL